MNELHLIHLLKTICPSNETVILGIDDDAAILRPSDTEALVCTDMLMDGVHFNVDTAGAEAVGRKALAVNLSDIAAMGGRALSAFISLALPRSKANESFVHELYRGINTLARRYGIAVAGGDTNIWDGPLVINVTVLGQAHVRGPIRRAGAQAGDVIFVTGPLGGSIESHHLHFTPRLDEAKALLDAFEIRSMMDISDGLGKDLRTMSEQSGVSAFLDRNAVPLRENIRHDQNALSRSFCDGEDFELCFTVSPAEAVRIEADSRFSYCTAIGTMKAEPAQGLFWAHDHSAIPWLGYEHGTSKKEAR